MYVLDLLKDLISQYNNFAIDLLNKLKLDKRIKYCIFSIQRGDKQNDKSFHLQGYLEFNKLVDDVTF